MTKRMRKLNLRVTLTHNGFVFLKVDEDAVLAFLEWYRDTNLSSRSVYDFEYEYTVYYMQKAHIVAVAVEESAYQ